ncbi:MAG: hypothetical protein ACFCVF_15875 [Kineosporiaceae bacterium]
MTTGALAVSPTGLLFLGVVVLWAVYLVPLWARERARASAERSAQREADLMREADTSQPRVVLTTGEPTLTSTARLNAVAVATRDVARARRALRRGRALRGLALVTGLAVVVTTAVGTVGAGWPAWSPGAAVAWLVTTTAAGALAAVNDRRRLGAARVRVSAARTLQPTTPAQTRSVPLFDRGRELLVDESEAVPAGRAWTPVEVPRPTYTTAPRVTHAPPLPWVDPMPAARHPAARAVPLDLLDPAEADAQRRAAAREAHHRAAQRRRAAG